jgi:ribosomal protein L28
VSAHGIRIISRRGIDRVVKDILAQGGRL